MGIIILLLAPHYQLSSVLVGVEKKDNLHLATRNKMTVSLRWI